MENDERQKSGVRDFASSRAMNVESEVNSTVGSGVGSWSLRFQR